MNYSDLILCIEEPENNLHPSLLRRLLNFLASERQEKSFTLVFTTHSPVCIDWAAQRDDSQIIHLRHEDGITKTIQSTSYLTNTKILDDLDVRASDLLQANGLIWVEGPTERVYLKKWISLISNHELTEDVHFAIMFYGGDLRSHVSLTDPNEKMNKSNYFQ